MLPNVSKPYQNNFNTQNQDCFSLFDQKQQLRSLEVYGNNAFEIMPKWCENKPKGFFDSFKIGTNEGQLFIKSGTRGYIGAQKTFFGNFRHIATFFLV